MKKKAVSGGRRAYILTMRILMGAAAIITAALVLFLIAYVLIKGLPNVSWALLSTAPSYLSDRIGIMVNGHLTALGSAAELIAQAGASNFEDAFIALAAKEGVQV